MHLDTHPHLSKKNIYIYIYVYTYIYTPFRAPCYDSMIKVRKGQVIWGLMLKEEGLGYKVYLDPTEPTFLGLLIMISL